MIFTQDHLGRDVEHVDALAGIRELGFIGRVTTKYVFVRFYSDGPNGGYKACSHEDLEWPSHGP